MNKHFKDFSFLFLTKLSSEFCRKVMINANENNFNTKVVYSKNF